MGIFGILAQKQRMKNEEMQRALSHLQEIEDEIELMDIVCQRCLGSQCLNCKYGTSPNACEKNDMIRFYNKKREEYRYKFNIK